MRQLTTSTNGILVIGEVFLKQAIKLAIRAAKTRRIDNSSKHSTQNISTNKKATYKDI